MKKVLFLIVALAVVSGSLSAQNRNVTRGAEPGELYLSGFWYAICYGPVNGYIKCSIRNIFSTNPDRKWNNK